MRKYLILAISAALQALFSTWVIAAASASVAAPNPSAMPVHEHAGHGAHAAGGMPGTKGSGSTEAWTAYPTLKTRMSGQAREDRVVTIVPQGIVADSIDVYSTDIKDAGAHRQLPQDMAGARLVKPVAGGFLWLAAREQQADKVRTASTVYFSSERGGQNPAAMLMQQKYELEIIPQPFPREHSRYRANEDWQFLVRFNGKPLANRKVFLETTNGSRTELMTDAQGGVSVRIPDDFKAEPISKTAGAHDHGRRSSDFVLATEYSENNKTYLTAFNASYGTDAYAQRSLAMGAGFALLGMIGAVPLLRQRKEKKQVADTAQTSSVQNANNEDA